jgi:Recombination endonuclease VII
MTDDTEALGSHGHGDSSPERITRGRIGGTEGLPVRKYTAADRALYRNYGLSPDDYDRALELQGGVCALCGLPPPGSRRLVVDDDHETGEIRGLLHRPCNGKITLRIQRYLAEPPLRQFDWHVPDGAMERRRQQERKRAETRATERETARRRRESGAIDVTPIVPWYIKLPLPSFFINTVTDLRRWQQGRCAMCGEVKQLQLDHDHVTDFVRGWLCASCNVVEGQTKRAIGDIRTMTHEQYAWVVYRKAPPAKMVGFVLKNAETPLAERSKLVVVEKSISKRDTMIPRQLVVRDELERAREHRETYVKEAREGR